MDATVGVNSTPADTADGRLHAPSWLRRLDWLWVLLVFFVAGGKPAPDVNETHYLTKAKHYWDPSYCPGDFFLDSADPHLTFYWTVGVLTKWFSLPATAWIGRLLAWSLLAAGWRRLVHAVSDAPLLAPLSAALWVVLIQQCNFAGEWVVGGVEAKCFAYGFLLFGLADLATGRWGRVWVWLGLASAMHVLVGAWAVLAVMAAWLLEPRGSRPALKDLLPGLILGGLLSLPGLLPSLALERGVPASVTTEAARIYVFERLPHHLAPLSLPRAELFARSWKFGLMTAVFIALWRWQRRSISNVVRQRISTFTQERESPSAALLRLYRIAGFALTASAAGLVLQVVLADSPDAAARVLRYYWFRQADVLVPLAIAIGGGLCLLAAVRCGGREAALALVPTLWCSGLLLLDAIDRAIDPIPPATKRIDNLPAWEKTCAWIAAATPADALFLTPRSAQSFKWYASRADVANRKDVPQDAASVVEWRRRCEELFPTVDWFGSSRTLESPAMLGASKLRVLAAKYGATHVIASTAIPLDLPRAFVSGSDGEGVQYAVYDLTSAEKREAP